MIGRGVSSDGRCLAFGRRRPMALALALAVAGVAVSAGIQQARAFQCGPTGTDGSGNYVLLLRAMNGDSIVDRSVDFWPGLLYGTLPTAAYESAEAFDLYDVTTGELFVSLRFSSASASRGEEWGGGLAAAFVGCGEPPGACPDSLPPPILGTLVVVESREAELVGGTLTVERQFPDAERYRRIIIESVAGEASGSAEYDWPE